MTVPIDSRDARLWLPFAAPEQAGPPNWFRDLTPAECKIRWTEDPENCQWTGILHRVERFDPMTRTVTVAIRIANNSDNVPASGLPLVEGMYCSVEIPGKPIPNVYRLPRWTVSFDGFTYIAEGDRLSRRAVNAVRTQGEETYVDEGLSPGELVVVTRLVDPLPGILLEYDMPEETDCAYEGEAMRGFHQFCPKRSIRQYCICIYLYWWISCPYTNGKGNLPGYSSGYDTGGGVFW